ncbi:MAG TPA: AAA family ATPase [Nitrospirae bacterium]|nr:AAA family ATPase [Nitrospirota bacterium]
MRSQTSDLAGYTEVYSFYGLKEQPFNITSDPHFFYNSRHHKEALFNLKYGIGQRKGFIEITGEIGTGKTTLCHMVIDQLDPETTKSALILNPGLSAMALLQVIIEDFGMEVFRKTKVAMFKQLNGFLIEESTKGRNVVLMIDEAQNLKPKTLEELRMISNLETRKEKLIQIVFVGQPELRTLLDSSSLRQLRQRINIRYHILPLQKEETRPYIDTRLKAASANGKVTVNFTNDSIDEIYNFSGGVPRLINVVCDRALLAGFVSESGKIAGEMIRNSVKEIEGLHS